MLRCEALSCCSSVINSKQVFQMETIQKRQRGKEMLEGSIRSYQMVSRQVLVDSRETVFHTLRMLRLVGVLAVTTGLRQPTQQRYDGLFYLSAIGYGTRSLLLQEHSSLLIFSWYFGHG